MMPRTPLLLCFMMFACSGCQDATLSQASLADEQAIQAGKSKLFESVPIVSPNPQRRAPLVAIVDVTAKEKVKAQLKISDGENSWVIDGPETPGKSFRLIAHGMRPDRSHEIRVQLSTPDGTISEICESLTFVTPPLPSSFPPLKVTYTQPDLVEPGTLLFPVNLWRDDKSIMNFGYLMAVNEKGELIWYLHTGHRTADVRVLQNGHILFQHGNYRYAFEIDLMGNIVRQWHASNLTKAPNDSSIPVPIDTMHHELAEHPNGNFFTLATTLKRFEEFPTSNKDPNSPWEPANVVCDQLVEFSPDTGEVLRRIELTKFLDTKRFGYLSLGTFWNPKYKGQESRDWSHANALILLPEEDAAIVSFRHHDCLIKIKLEMEEIEWIFGSPQGWDKKWTKYFLKPVGSSFEWPFHQHGPQFSADGRLRLYDNGNYRARPFDKHLEGHENHSRVVEYQIDEASKTVRQIYEYDGAPDDMFFCPFYCEADRMPTTQNLLITDGGHVELDDGTPFNEVPGKHQWARIFEITNSDPPKKVFEVKFESPLRSRYGWSIYRSTKLKSLSDIKNAIELIPSVQPSQQIEDSLDKEDTESEQ